MDEAVFDNRRTSFGNQAEAYARGRPSYPAEALEWLLPDGAQRVLDLAAGTGRLTERLLATGVSVVAVEPLAEMRSYIPDGAEVLDGTAEAIPLDGESVDAVVVGQAFHWFDVTRATAEIRRVLRPGGRVGLLWNLLDDTEPWVDRLANVLDAEERASLLRADQQAPFGRVPGLSDPERRLFHHGEPYDVDRLLAFVHSRSQTILLGATERAALLAKVREVTPTGEFALPLLCEVWRASRTDHP